MQIEFEMTDDILIVNLDGELDHHFSTVIREEIDKTIDTFHSKHLIFNFEKVDFMDSSGIGVIMGRYNKISQLKGRLLITGCSEYIDRILEMAGIYTIATRMKSVADSIECIKHDMIEKGAKSENE
ncbi:MAG: anti-sigma factor antagonist [Eubacteriales bacterium]|nr:anti-sigma factor antagonist [Eubacteriales bacterium]